MPPVINKDECSVCGMCSDICPQDVFFNSNDGDTPVVTYPEECWHCNCCVLDCPSEAIRLRIPLYMHIPYKPHGAEV